MYRVGDIVAGEYSVSRVFTNGGMGVVYKVHRPGWDVDMAMKCPRAELFDNDAQRNAFIRECETWMKLGSHPNIVSCYYIKNIDAVPSVFMEYASGGSLHDRIVSGLLYEGTPEESLRRIIDYSIQTVRGLSHAHQKGYIHQDVKPANVLVTSLGIVKVSDFGLSKAKGVVRKSAFVEDGRSLVVSSGGWTPAYGSPEQALGRPLTRRTDIWSWAVMILEMIHGSIFWKAGPLASRALQQLWPWQIFSPKVKASRGLVKILRECLEECEERRPKDFDAVEARLLVLYHDVFGTEYPRNLPASMLMAEASLINRIASYAELELSGRDCYREVYDCLCELHSISPWAIWGDLNYAAYLHSHGLSVQELCPIIENLLLSVRSESDKRWLLDVLISLGMSSPRNALIARLWIGGSEVLRNLICAEHAMLRKKLHDLFDRELRCVTGTDVECSRTGSVCRSENGMVEVKAAFKEGNWGDYDLSLVVKTDNGCFRDVSSGFPARSHISFISVDNKALRISVWICVDSGWYQKKYTLENGHIVPYRCDFRKSSKWGFPHSVHISGDARIMMVYYGCGRCSVWLNQLGGIEDGRNICDLNLFDFGLIPPDNVLPGLVFETGYEYGMSPEIAYPLMKLLATTFGQRRFPCYVVRPESSSSELRRSQEISCSLEQANCAFVAKNNAQFARMVKHCLELGALPEERLLAIRHRDVSLIDGSRPTACWRSASINEYWENPIESISSIAPNKFQLATIGYKPRSLCMSESEHGLLTGYWPWTFFPEDEAKGSSDRYYIAVAGCENKDAIFACCQNGSLKWLRRISVDAQGKQQVIWECMIPRGGTGIEFLRSLQQTDSLIAFTVDYQRVVSVSKRSGEMLARDFDEYIDYFKVDFEESSSMAFLAVTKKRIVALGPDGVAVPNGKPIYRLARRFELLDVSDSGCVALGKDCWGGVHICDLKTGRVHTLHDCNPFDIACHPCIGKGSAKISRTGRVAVIVTDDCLLKLYDVVHRRLMFSWKLNRRGGMCFDSSERWLAVAHKEIEVFQLFWDTTKEDEL